MRCRLCRRVACRRCSSIAPANCSAHRAPPPPAGVDPTQRTLREVFGLELVRPPLPADPAGSPGDRSNSLAAAVAAPVPPTLRRLPFQLQRRILELYLKALSDAVIVLEREQDVCEALEIHRWLWLMPALLVPAPSSLSEAVAAESSEAADLPYNPSITQAVRRRLELAETEQWDVLLREHLDRVEARPTVQPRTVAAIGVENDNPEETKRLAMSFTTKVRGGCLKTATHLLLGQELADPSEATTQELTRLVAAPADKDERAATQAAATRILETIHPGKLAGRRTVRRRIFALRAGAEPGPSGWRNGYLQHLVRLPEALDILVRWCRIWATGKVPGCIAALWTQAALVAPLKPNGGIRPIALGETLLKLAEVVLLEECSAKLRRLLEPHQLGCRTPAGAEAALMALRVATRQKGVCILQLDLRNAYGMITRRELLDAAAAVAPDLARMAAAEWINEGGVTAWHRTYDGWQAIESHRGGWQGSPLMQTLFAVAATWRLRATFADDTTSMPVEPTLLPVEEHMCGPGDVIDAEMADEPSDLPEGWARKGQRVPQAVPGLEAELLNTGDASLPSAAPGTEDEMHAEVCDGWVAYADDTHVFGRPSVVLRRLRSLIASLPAGGHELCLPKCHVWCPTLAALPTEERAAYDELCSIVSHSDDGAHDPGRCHLGLRDWPWRLLT